MLLWTVNKTIKNCINLLNGIDNEIYITNTTKSIDASNLPCTISASVGVLHFRSVVPLDRHPETTSEMKEIEKSLWFDQ